MEIVHNICKVVSCFKPPDLDFGMCVQSQQESSGKDIWEAVSNSLFGFLCPQQYKDPRHLGKWETDEAIQSIMFAFSRQVKRASNLRAHAERLKVSEVGGIWSATGETQRNL